MSNKITEIKRVLKAGARQSKYRVLFTFPTAVKTNSDLRDINTLCKSTSFPSVTIGQIEVFNQGRKLVLPGDTAYENTWTCQFYNQEDHQIRLDFLAWQKAIDNFNANTHSGVPGELMVDMVVQQLDSAENVTAFYTFQNVFPSEVGSIEVAADSVDAIQEFDITFAFSDWIVGAGPEFSTPEQKFPATENITSIDQ